MSRVRADQYTNSNADGAPLFPDGLRVSGVVTATSGSFTGNVSIGGTLTYEDVTNVDLWVLSQHKQESKFLLVASMLLVL